MIGKGLREEDFGNDFLDPFLLFGGIVGRNCVSFSFTFVKLVLFVCGVPFFGLLMVILLVA